MFNRTVMSYWNSVTRWPLDKTWMNGCQCCTFLYEMLSLLCHFPSATDCFSSLLLAVLLPLMVMIDWLLLSPEGAHIVTLTEAVWNGSRPSSFSSTSSSAMSPSQGRATVVTHPLTLPRWEKTTLQQVYIPEALSFLQGINKDSVYMLITRKA